MTATLIFSSDSVCSGTPLNGVTSTLEFILDSKTKTAMVNGPVTILVVDTNKR